MIIFKKKFDLYFSEISEINKFSTENLQKKMTTTAFSNYSTKLTCGDCELTVKRDGKFGRDQRMVILDKLDGRLLPGVDGPVKDKAVEVMKANRHSRYNKGSINNNFYYYYKCACGWGTGEKQNKKTYMMLLRLHRKRCGHISKMEPALSQQCSIKKKKVREIKKLFHKNRLENSEHQLAPEKKK